MSNKSENSENSSKSKTSNNEDKEFKNNDKINIEKDYTNCRDIKDLDEMVKKECLKNKKFLC